MPALVAVLGPTATGKSALGLALAERLDGEIINCDSTAVYRGFDIGTDKLPLAERRGIPHHLIDIAGPTDEYTAAQFARDAAAAVQDIHARGKLPILVGIAPIPSARSAKWMREKLFGTIVPDALVERLEKAANPKAEGRRVAANSVYRILDLFVGTNLARRVESANAYVANAHPGCLHDCIFLICDNCGQATHLDNDKLSGGVREAAEGAGFAEVRPVIEVRGRCGDCS